MKQNNMEGKAATAVIITVIVVLIIAIFGFLYFNNSSSPAVDVSLGEESQLDQTEIDALIKAVRKHIVLPEDEEPLVATIVNIDELVAEQAFYQGAENGDILMIYGSIAKALIYNPREDKLVNVGPVEVQQNAAAPVIPAVETIGE